MVHHIQFWDHLTTSNQFHPMDQCFLRHPSWRTGFSSRGDACNAGIEVHKGGDLMWYFDIVNQRITIFSIWKNGFMMIYDDLWSINGPFSFANGSFPASGTTGAHGSGQERVHGLGMDDQPSRLESNGGPFFRRSQDDYMILFQYPKCYHLCDSPQMITSWGLLLPV